MTTHPIQAHEQRMEAIEETVRSHDDRLRAMEQSGAAREEKIASQWIAIGKIERSVELIQQAVAEIKNRAGKRWENAVGYFVAAVIAALIGYFVGGK